MQKPVLRKPWKVVREDKWIAIYHPIKEKDGWSDWVNLYDIAMDRINSRDDVMSWCGQLMEKNWCTAELIGAFLYEVSQIKGDLRGEWRHDEPQQQAASRGRRF